MSEAGTRPGVRGEGRVAPPAAVPLLGLSFRGQSHRGRTRDKMGPGPGLKGMSWESASGDNHTEGRTRERWPLPRGSTPPAATAQPNCSLSQGAGPNAGDLGASGVPPLVLLACLGWCPWRRRGCAPDSAGGCAQSSAAFCLGTTPAAMVPESWYSWDASGIPESPQGQQGGLPPGCHVSPV